MTQTQLERVSVNELNPHKLNKEIYTNQDISELVEKIDEYGYKEEHPLLVTTDNKILSGHRRWKAAKQLNIETVPVQRVDPDSEQEELLTLLLANKYRDKTPAEKINEGEAWEKIEQERAKERKAHGKTAPGKNAPDNSTTSEGTTREKVGEKIGVSGSTYERGKEVKEKAEEGDEKAQEEWEQLESGEQSIHGAYSEVKSSENELDSGSDSSERDLNTPEYSWINTATKADVEVQARDCDVRGKYLVHVNGEDYKIKTDLFNNLFEEHP